MKKLITILCILFLLTVLVLTACTNPEENEGTSEETLQEINPDNENKEDSEDTQMEALISEKVGDCHNLNFILSKNKTREEWSTTIDRMINKGAEINAEEKERIIEWLISRNE